jgi:hypothetical protein
VRGAVNSFSPLPLSSPSTGRKFLFLKLNYDTATLREVRDVVNFFITDIITDNKELHLKKSRVLRGGQYTAN